jgi:hypothetical protein
MNPNNLQGPLVHLNGTSATELEAQMRACGDTLRAALNALYLAAPNARDYYPLGDCAFAEAQARHMGRIMAVEAVFKGCQAILEEIVDQVDARGR